VRIILPFFFATLVLFAAAQTNQLVLTNHPNATNTNSETVQNQISESAAFAREVEETRAACIQSRRRICGKIVKVLPSGLIVDSGYTNLMREPLNHSWLMPSTVETTRQANLVEENQPGSVCMGLVFLTDIPKGPGANPKVYDYVNLEAFPVGPHTYVSVGDLRRTVRGFSSKLAKSVDWKLGENKKERTPAK
jgi:hypothetical protein